MRETITFDTESPTELPHAIIVKPMIAFEMPKIRPIAYYSNNQISVIWHVVTGGVDYILTVIIPTSSAAIK